MRDDFFHQALMRDPSTDWMSFREFNYGHGNGVHLYLLHLSSWSFEQWHRLVSRHPCTMLSHGLHIFENHLNLFTTGALRHFRRNEDLFVYWCSHRPLSTEQWKQITQRIPKYAVHRVLFL